jgi:hypothetical protein
MVARQIQQTIHELISAQSALNQKPKPIQNPTGTYLPDTDEYAKIVYEHVSNALTILMSIDETDA